MKIAWYMTLYLWDMANTLILEQWNKELTGFDSFLDYAISLGRGPENPRRFEEAFYEPYIHGDKFGLRLSDGFKEVLEWTKYNETFSTGFAEQMDWRAQYLNPKVGFDIKKYFQKFNSTFDFGETNVKTKEMIIEYLKRKIAEGYVVVVYTDDKMENGELFRRAVEETRKNYPDFTFRFYHIKNDGEGLRDKGWYWEIGGLLDLKENERNFK